MSAPSEARVLFFIATFETGGAERACLNYLNHLESFRSVLVLRSKCGSLLQELNPDIPVLELSSGNLKSESSQAEGWRRNMREVWSQLPLARPMLLLTEAYRLQKLARQTGATAVTSFITPHHLFALFAKVFFHPRLKVVINVHDVTSRILEHGKFNRYERFLLRWLVRLFYPRAELIVAVAEGIKRHLVEGFGIPAQKIAVIYNPIDVQQIRARAAEPVAHPWLDRKEGLLVVAVGRLVKLKGFDLLIRAVARLPKELKVRLVIIGDGEERQALEQLIDQLGLHERAALLGFQENPWKYMARADVFVLSSVTEGLPNVIGEALALGLPIVATDCSPAMSEYVQDGQAGLLVPSGDALALAQALERLLTDSELRQRLAQNAYERVEAFDLPRVVAAYEATLARVIGG